MPEHKLRGSKLIANNRGTASGDDGDIFGISPEKINVGIIFGGVSTEHEVSLWSAKNVAAACIEAGYGVHLIYVKKDGTWSFAKEYSDVLQGSSSREILENTQRVSGNLVRILPNVGLEVLGEVLDLQVIFPVIHGTTGEDGVLQGCLEIAGIPYVGCGVTTSAIGMDKVITKILAQNVGIPIAKYLVATNESFPEFVEVEQSLGLPLFVKPASLGSSVGVTKVRNEKEYREALILAFSVDSKVLIEEAIVGKEIECGVLEHDGLHISGVGEIATTHDFYSFEAKYLDEHGATVTLPAAIPNEAAEQIRAFALLLAQTLGVNGLSRIDFFYTAEGKIILNEINTLPGFTAISMYPMLWKHEGHTSKTLIEALVDSALQR